MITRVLLRPPIINNARQPLPTIIALRLFKSSRRLRKAWSVSDMITRVLLRPPIINNARQPLPTIIALRYSNNPSAYASGCCSWPRRGLTTGRKGALFFAGPVRGRRNDCQRLQLVAPCRGPGFLDDFVLPVERPRWGLFSNETEPFWATGCGVLRYSTPPPGPSGHPPQRRGLLFSKSMEPQRGPKRKRHDYSRTITPPYYQ